MSINIADKPDWRKLHNGNGVFLMRYKDHKGLIWVRSEDGTQYTSSNGLIATGKPDMSPKSIISNAYKDDLALDIEPIDPILVNEQKNTIVGSVVNFFKSIF